MRSTFTPRARGSVLQGLYAGLTLVESIERAGLAEQTVKGWLTRGRQDPDSEHGRFAAAVDEARDVAARADMTLAEFRGHLNRAVRAGSVSAMRLWLTLHQSEQDEADDDPFAEVDGRLRRRGEPSIFDELAQRARARADHDHNDEGDDDE